MSDHSDFIAGYCELYEQYFGSPYLFGGAKDGTAAKRLLASGVEVEEALNLVRAAFTQNGYPYDNAATLAGFVAAWPLLIAKESKRLQRSPTFSKPVSRWELQRQIEYVKEQIAAHPHNLESVHENTNMIVAVPLDTWRQKLAQLKQQYALL